MEAIDLYRSEEEKFSLYMEECRIAGREVITKLHQRCCALLHPIHAASPRAVASTASPSHPCSPGTCDCEFCELKNLAANRFCFFLAAREVCSQRHEESKIRVSCSRLVFPRSDWHDKRVSFAPIIIAMKYNCNDVRGCIWEQSIKNYE